MRGASLVDKDLMGIFTSRTDKRYLADAAFHHPLEVAVEETIDEKDVEGSLVIGYEDIGLPRFEMFPAFHLDWQQKQANRKLTPPLAGIVAPEMTIAYQTTENGQQCSDNSVYQKQWYDAKFIETV